MTRYLWRDEISADICRYLHICADICRYYYLQLFMKVHTYNTILSARCTIQLPCLPRTPRGPIGFVTASLLAAAAVTSLSGTVFVRHRRCPAGRRHRFRGGGRGGVIAVVVIRVCAPHVVKEMPSVVIVRMGEDDRPSPTTTHHVLPVWRCRREAVRRGRQRERWQWRRRRARKFQGRRRRLLRRPPTRGRRGSHSPGLRRPPPSPNLGGGHDRHRPRNADDRDRRLPPAHAPPRATATTTTTMTTTTRRGRSWRTPPRR